MSKNMLPIYIQHLLDPIIQNNGFVNYTMEIKSGSKPGDGYNSEVLSIIIAEKSRDKKLKLISKACKDAKSFLFFNREVLFYTKLMPILHKFQNEANLSKTEQFSFPKCYAAIADDICTEYVILMEDICALGFHMWNKNQVTPIAHLRLVMIELGKFHGLSIAMKDLKPHEFTELKLSNDPFGTTSQTLMENIFYAFFDMAINVMKHEHHKNIIRDIKDNYGKYVKHCINSPTADHFLVLLHGDLWNNNILYRDNEEGIVEETRFLDWQQCLYGSVALDLVTILFSSTDKAIRSNEMDNLLKIYYDSLTKMVKLLGSNPNKIFNLIELKHEMKRCGNYVLVLAPILIPGSSNHQIERNDLNQSVNDNSSKKRQHDLAFKFNDKDLNEFDRRMNEILEDVYDLGYYQKINFEI